MVPYYRRNSETKRDELQWTPRLHTTVCPCVLKGAMPTPEECGLGGREHMTLDTFDPSDLLTTEKGAARWQALQRWVDGLPETAAPAMQWPGAIFWGPNGNGKTTLAAGLAHAALAAGVRPRFLTEASFFDRFTRNYDHENGATGSDASVVASLGLVPLLVIDDMGKGADKGRGGPESASWRADRLEQVIDERKRTGRPTMLTTNVRYADWPQRFGNALASRLGGYLAVHFEGRDRR